LRPAWSPDGEWPAVSPLSVATASDPGISLIPVESGLRRDFLSVPLRCAVRQKREGPRGRRFPRPAFRERGARGTVGEARRDIARSRGRKTSEAGCPAVSRLFGSGVARRRLPPAYGAPAGQSVGAVEGDGIDLPRRRRSRSPRSAVAVSIRRVPAAGASRCPRAV